MYIMHLLTEGPIRFNELQRKMPEEMTHTTLSRQLKKLEEEGLIERIEYQQIPPKVEYKLSDIGEKFRKVLKELEIWGNEYIQYLNDKEWWNILLRIWVAYKLLMFIPVQTICFALTAGKQKRIWEPHPDQIVH